MSAVRRILVTVRAWLRGQLPPATATVPADTPGEYWCLVGNVVDTHEYGQQKEIRSGSKRFSAGTQVYCLPAQWGDGYEKVVAIGLHRGTRQWVTVVMPSDQITNWRAKPVYKAAVLRRLR